MMNNETNDQRIMLLKKQIESKKEQLIKGLRFSPITNCSIEVDGIRHNIQVLIKEELNQLLVKLNSYLLSAKDLGFTRYSISGYEVESWITDIKSRIAILLHKEEEKALKIMEDKLHRLLSEGKKVELEINDIELFLKS